MFVQLAPFLVLFHDLRLNMSMKRLKDVNWNHLYSFYEVAKAQSLKDGAQRLGVASPTISAQLKKLEEVLEMQLFHRSSKGLTLTAEGQQVFDRTKGIFEEGSKLLELFTDEVVGGYPVTIGIEDTVSFDLATEFASQYWDMYAEFGTVNTIRQSEHAVIVDNLIKGNIDWAISVRPSSRKAIVSEEIGSFDLVFCCAKELWDRFKSFDAVLENIPFVESSWDKRLNRAIMQSLRRNGIVPREKIFSDHLDYVTKLCERGRCVMFLPKNPLKQYPDLKFFEMDEPIRMHLYALWKKEDEGLISIRKLKDLVQTQLTVLPNRYQDIELQIDASDVDDIHLEDVED